MQRLLTSAEVLEREILAFCRRKLGTGIDSFEKMIDNTLVAIHARFCLYLSTEDCVTILTLASGRHCQHALETESSLIPSWTLGIETCKLGIFNVGSIRRNSAESLLRLEVSHTCSLSLDDDEIDAWTHLISLRIISVSGNILTDIILEIRSHLDLRNGREEIYCFIYSRDKHLIVKISKI